MTKKSKVNLKNSAMKLMHFYPGRDINYSYIAVSMANTLIHGTKRESRAALLNNLIVKVVEEQGPGSVQIHIVDADNLICQPYLDIIKDGRDIQHITEVESLSEVPDVLGSAIEYLKCWDDYTGGKCVQIIILAGFDMAIKDAESEPGRVRELFNCVSALCKRSNNDSICVIADFGDKHLPETMIQGFTNKFVCPTVNEAMSQKLIGSNWASCVDINESYLWVKIPRKDVVRLYIPKRPEGWTKRIVRTFSLEAGLIRTAPPEAEPEPEEEQFAEEEVTEEDEEVTAEAEATEQE